MTEELLQVNAKDPSEEYYDLGSFHRPVTTNSKDAQLWFNRGLAWSYGFHHEESAECFKRAIAIDSGCAMAYWGLAYALGKFTKLLKRCVTHDEFNVCCSVNFNTD